MSEPRRLDVDEAIAAERAAHAEAKHVAGPLLLRTLGGFTRLVGVAAMGDMILTILNSAETVEDQAFLAQTINDKLRSPLGVLLDEHGLPRDGVAKQAFVGGIGTPRQRKGETSN